MHHALEIQEVLLNIFQSFLQDDRRRDLVTLARTCRGFYEPAMDVLWRKLDDLSILGQRLGLLKSDDNSPCSFHRSLTQAEWDILYSCTRRTRTISLVTDVHKLEENSLKMLLKPLTKETLFPNVRHLYCYASDKAIALLLRLSFPSLLLFSVEFSDGPRLFGNHLGSLARTSPNLKRLTIVFHSSSDISRIDPSFLCQWKNLQSVECPPVCLDLNSLVYLSDIPTLTNLRFTLRETLLDRISPSDPPVVFSNLRSLYITSESLFLVSQLVSRTRLPAITDFTVTFHRCTSKQDFSSLLTSVQMSGMGHNIENLMFFQGFAGDEYIPGAQRPVLDMKDFAPCMASRHLRRIHFDNETKVELTDSDLITLTSAWPHLEEFAINQTWGWHSRGGITPNGLLQFLQANPSLVDIAIAIDTHGSTEVPPSLAHPELTLPTIPYINVVDSFIKAESVPAIIAFFASLKAPSQFLLHSWDQWKLRMGIWQDVDVSMCEPLWDDVCRQVNCLANLTPTSRS